MNDYHVWAPRAERVRLFSGGQSYAMQPMPNGWWTLADDDARSRLSSGEEYGYLLDDDPRPVPDPRSRRQPNDVDGLSLLFDHAAHAWTDEDWTGRQLAGGMIYELHVGTFTPEGTLDAAIGHLDHLVEIGASFVELLPVNGFDGTHNWGYDGVFWFTVDETYGGPAAYQRFVDACHARGMAVIQDVVYNHFGPADNPLPRFGPYVHDERTTGWGASVDLQCDEVRRFIIDNAMMWLRDYHVDGLRLDAVHALIDTSPIHILQSLAEEVDALSVHLGRPLTLIAESDLNEPKLITPREAGGFGVHAQWSDDFHHAVHVALTGETTGYYADFERLGAMAKVVTKGFFHDGTYSTFREQKHGRPIDVERTPTWRLVVGSQNHDQIGNRATGDRLTATLDAGQLAIAAVLTMTSPFTPMLFMGEEWGASTPWQFFTAHVQPDLAEATVEGRIKEFERMGWDPDAVPDPQDDDTFARSKLDWNELQRPGHAQLLSLYRELARLRRQTPDLTNPRFTETSVEYDEEAGWFVMTRGSTVVAVNFADVPSVVAAVGTMMLTTDQSVVVRDFHVELPPHSAVVLANDRAR